MIDFTTTQTATIDELVKTYKAMEAELDALPKPSHWLSTEEERAADTPAVAARRYTLTILMAAAKSEAIRISDQAFAAMSDDYRAGDDRPRRRVG